MKISWFRDRLGALALALMAGSAAAQVWPTRPINWIVPYQAGSSPDITVRVVAEAMAEILRQPIVVDNKPGAAGNVGAQLAARAPADGYTWVYSAAPMAGNMRMYKQPGYDVLKDFFHISQIGTSEAVVMVHPDSGIQSVRDLLARAKANPGKLSYGSGGNGTPAHLVAELLLNASGTDALHIPYKGAAASVVALMGREIDFSVPMFAVGLQPALAGKLRALAVTGPRRNPRLPDVPTLAEAGVPGVQLVSFGGLSVPAGTPPAVAGRIGEALRQALERPSVRAKLEAAGSTSIGASTPEQYLDLIRGEIAATERMMRAAKLEVQ